MNSATNFKLSAIIIDDELYGRENLKKIIEAYCTEIEILAVADSVVAGKNLVSVHNPDVVFLDINMPVLDGFDFLAEFDERNFMAVFVSAYEEYGVKAVKAGAADYLLKPISIKELKQSVKKLLSLHSKKNKEPLQNSEKLILPASHGFNVLVIENIIRLEADGSCTKVFVKEGKAAIVSRTLKDFEDALSKEIFFRVHKSHLINLNCIKNYSHIDGGFVIMEDGSKVEISRRKAPEFIQKIKAVINAV
jgi:two-component system, LytTR family, response regulator